MRQENQTIKFCQSKKLKSPQCQVQVSLLPEYFLKIIWKKLRPHIPGDKLQVVDNFFTFPPYMSVKSTVLIEMSYAVVILLIFLTSKVRLFHIQIYRVLF